MSKTARAKEYVELAAGIGVKAGIVFLALELAQNNELLRAQARADRAEVRIDAYRTMLENPMLIDAYQRRGDGAELTPTEQSMLRTHARQVLTRWQFVYTEYREGWIDLASIPIADWRRNFQQNPDMRRILETDRRSGFRDDFIEFLESEVLTD